MMIKFSDIQKINAQYKQEFKEAFNRVIDSGWYFMKNQQVSEKGKKIFYKKKVLRLNIF